jgi:hypothetical protein
MKVLKVLKVLALALMIGICADQAPAQDQSNAESDAQIINGRVVSSTRNTITVRTDDGKYHLFVLDNYTVRPQSIPVGSSVRVFPAGDEENGARVARTVTVTSTAPVSQTEEPDAIPEQIRSLERDIERSVKRYGLGVHGGLALDPELVLVGVHANLGSIFADRLTVRPGAEFAWGEVTNMFALNLEASYRLPISPPRGRWSAYIGGGPAFLFASRNFSAAEEGDREINFDDLDFQAGLNLFSGVEFRSGLFMEAKTTVYASPHLRLIIGYNF